MKRNSSHLFAVSALMALSAAGLLVAQETEVHVSQSEAMKAAREKPAPEYPAIAKQLHLEGEVQVQAHISENGSVEDVKPLTGNAVLASAAVNAMKHWKFTPFTSDGKAHKAITEVSFNFKL